MARAKAAIKLESRVAALEAEVKQLYRKIEAATPNRKPWWEHVVGAFADDPDFLEAMRLGREYRESLRPKSANRTKSAKSRRR